MRAAVTVLLALLLALPAGRSVADQDQPRVVITATALEPRVLQTTTAQQVMFVNRSGQAVHVEFQGRSEQRHVFWVTDQIWARFHNAGVHQYVVHFSLSRGRDLRGWVEVGHVPEPEGELHTCTWVSVMENCIEP